MIHIEPITKANWQDALAISLHETQKTFVPSVIESLAYAYIKPWDEALDPYILYKDEIVVGFFYLSYTPNSKDNYWIGGYQIDKQYQGKGFGKQTLAFMLAFITEKHQQCEIISLTIEKENMIARKLYESLGFIAQNRENECGEFIYSRTMRIVNI